MILKPLIRTAWIHKGTFHVSSKQVIGEDDHYEYSYLMGLDIGRRPSRKIIRPQTGGRLKTDYVELSRNIEEMRPLTCPTYRRIEDFRFRHYQV